MKLPRFIASGGVRETGLVRAQDIGALTNVGDAEFRAIEQTGRAIGHVSDLAFKAGMKRKALDDDIRWGNATTKIEEGHQTSFEALKNADYSIDEPLPDDPNYNKAPLQLSLEKKAALTKDALAERDKQAKEIELSFPTREGKERFKLWYAEKRLDYNKDYTKINNAKHDAYQKARLTTLATNAYLAGDVATGDSYIDSMDENELITPLMAMNQKVAGVKQWHISQSKLQPDKIIAEMQAKKESLGEKGVSEEGLSAIDYDDIIASAIAAKNLQKSINDTENREAKRDLYKKEDDGVSLTRTDFEAAYKDPDEADQRWDEYKAGQLAELRNEVNFIKEGDPVILARTEAAIDLNPMSVTEEFLYTHATQGIGTVNITRLVDRLRKAKEKAYTQVDKYDTQFSTLLNAGYFGKKDKQPTSTTYLELKRKMSEYIKTQKPTEEIADAFFNGLITKGFAVKGPRWAGGGWDENGFNHTYTDTQGNEITQRFRYGDVRKRKVGKTVIEEFYAGTDDKGLPQWIPRR